MEACSGKYIAFCEGDDYWTCPNKLQRQIDFLDDHPDYSICFHSVMIISEDEPHEPIMYCPPGRKDTYYFEDLFEGNFIPACSVVYRNRLFDQFPSWYDRMPVGDWPLHMLNAQHGKIGYIDECMSVYRKHSGGMSSSLSPDERLKVVIDVLVVLRDAFGKRYRNLVYAGLCKYHCRSAINCSNDGNFRRAREHERKCLVKIFYNRYVPVSNLLKMVLKVHFPYFWRWCKVAHSWVTSWRSGSPAG